MRMRMRMRMRRNLSSYMDLGCSSWLHLACMWRRSGLDCCTEVSSSLCRLNFFAPGTFPDWLQLTLCILRRDMCTQAMPLFYSSLCTRNLSYRKCCVRLHRTYLPRSKISSGRRKVEIAPGERARLVSLSLVWKSHPSPRSALRFGKHIWYNSDLCLWELGRGTLTRVSSKIHRKVYLLSKQLDWQRVRLARSKQ